MDKKQSMLLPIMLAMSEMDVVHRKPQNKSWKKPRKKLRDCKMCGEPVYHDSLTCSKECYLKHKNHVNQSQ